MKNRCWGTDREKPAPQATHTLARSRGRRQVGQSTWVVVLAMVLTAAPKRTTKHRLDEARVGKATPGP